MFLKMNMQRYLPAIKTLLMAVVSFIVFSSIFRNWEEVKQFIADIF
jgi:uncharacterized protein YebE (UPF0316 family)